MRSAFPRRNMMITGTGLSLVLISGLFLARGLLQTHEPDFVDEGAAEIDAALDEHGRQILTHDFGLVMCGTDRLHEFEVANTSSIPWTIKSISSSCTCSVLAASERVIDPGGTGRFVMEYRAPSAPKNHAGDVELRFLEDSAPEIVFSVTAMVRNPLTPSAGELRFELAPSGECERELRVDNFSGRKWSGIDFATLPDWLSLEGIRPVAVESPYTQSWLVKLAARDAADDGPHGLQTQFVTVRAVGKDLLENSEAPPQSEVRVTRLMTEEYVLTPTSLQFGPIPVGDSKSASVMLRSKTAPFKDLEQLKVQRAEAPSEFDLDVELTLSSPKVVVITATCHPHGGHGVISNALSLNLPNGRVRRLPFSGRIVADEE